MKARTLSMVMMNLPVQPAQLKSSLLCCVCLKSVVVKGAPPFFSIPLWRTLGSILLGFGVDPRRVWGLVGIWCRLQEPDAMRLYFQHHEIGIPCTV
ncbi:hypothetical protein N658DRAFT_288012 [Parathielavia hyrcaniae]|uniref:Uncharacterized protein n=1 Tax=Parathielavia hyrcaniae TaxID=113614 RepID=A0AAN6PT69_9PEZI|nr:hypothetical protein N658DRAFT_288012 [Parathielavia hyrcaniae]